MSMLEPLAFDSQAMTNRPLDWVATTWKVWAPVVVVLTLITTPVGSGMVLYRCAKISLPSLQVMTKLESDQAATQASVQFVPTWPRSLTCEPPALRTRPRTEFPFL